MTNKVAIAFLEGLKTYQLKTEREALDMAIKALEQEPKWIPVIARLPKTKGTYLVTVPQIDGASEFIYISVWTGNEWIPSNRILAWQPLPEPYKESEECYGDSN